MFGGMDESDFADTHRQVIRRWRVELVTEFFDWVIHAIPRAWIKRQGWQM
jgi:hypothetical protein